MPTQNEEVFMATMAYGRLSEPVSTPVAAYVAGVSEKTIWQAIERSEIRPCRQAIGQRNEYVFDVKDLVYLRLRSRVRGFLGATGRRCLYEAMSQVEDQLEGLQLGIELQLSETMYLRLDSIVEEVMCGLKAVSTAEEWVTSEPGIRGGEPVVRGTRVPVYLLADLQSKGVSSEEILADYPSITPEALRAAITWSKLHPKRGRPSAGARWRANRIV
jgi:uncharacterized protein (DUF433 family)